MRGFQSLLASWLLVCAGGAAYAFDLEADLFPAVGESNSLYPGGPKLTRARSSLDISFGPTRRNGYMRALYDKSSRLKRIETYNGRGVRITWTDFGDGIETAYDLEEAGKASRWTRTAREGSRMARIEEKLDPATGRRVEVSRRYFNGAQSADSCGTANEPVDRRVFDTIDEIAKKFKGGTNACPDERSALKFSDGAHPFNPLGPVCVDEGCRLNGNFSALLRDTLREGTSCLARLGSERLSQDEAKTAVETVSGIPRRDLRADENSALLNKSFALRNAAQLLMLYNQSDNFGVNWSSKQQTWLTSTDARLTSASTERVRGSLGVPATGPIKIMCANSDRPYSISDGSGPINEFDPGRGLMTSTLPGSAGWPLVRISPGLGRTYGGDPDEALKDETDKAVLFHEFMHLIGYPHDDSGEGGGQLNAAGGGATVPTHGACQACCFPGGWTSSQLWTPSDAECGTKSPNHQKICAVCAGDAGTDRGRLDSQALDSYSSAMGSCYRNKSPL